MPNAEFTLEDGLFVDVLGDWRVYVAERDPFQSAVFYVGAYPYADDGQALHPSAPAIIDIWDPLEPGARQISERQKRLDLHTAPWRLAPVAISQSVSIC